MANRFLDKVHNGTLTSPTELTDTASNRELVQNRPEAAGIAYDRASKTFKYNGSGELRTLSSNYKRVITPTAAYALSAGESGSEVMLNAAAGFAITLPAPSAGLWYRFTVAAAFATTDFTIVTSGGSNIIQGGAMVAGAEVTAADEDTITFVADGEEKGDWVEVWSDGTSWFVNGRAVTASKLTFTSS